MNALPLSQPPEQPRRRRRSQSSVSPEQRHQSRHRLVAIETVVKLGVNLVISGAAIAALTQLLPYSMAQQEKLKEIQTEVNSANGRFSKVQSEFGRSFDPHQTSEIIRQQTGLVDPNQKVVVWGDGTAPSNPTP
jgi:hypothetical protein